MIHHLRVQLCFITARKHRNTATIVSNRYQRYPERDEIAHVAVSVSSDLGITGTQLKTWWLEIEAFGSSEAKHRQKADAAEVARLRKENKRLAEEVEILHKASAFFATRAVKP